MLVKKEVYRGLWINTNQNTRFLNNPIYYTILNPHLRNKDGTLVHIHCKYKSDTLHIIDCFQDMKHGKWYNMRKYKQNQKNLAMGLFGLPIYKNTLN